MDGDNTKCSKCGEQDHLSRNCPKCAKCFRCQEKGHFKRDCPQAQAPLAGGNGNCFDSNELTEMESAPILMNLVNGDGSRGRGGRGGPSDRGGYGGPQAQAPLAGGKGNFFDSNELTETESAPILMGLVNGNGSGGRGGHCGPSGEPRENPLKSIEQNVAEAKFLLSDLEKKELDLHDEQRSLERAEEMNQKLTEQNEEMSRLETEIEEVNKRIDILEKENEILKKRKIEKDNEILKKENEILKIKKENSIMEDSKNLYGQAKYRKGLVDINKAIKKASVS